MFEAGSGGAALELLDCHPETELAVIDFAMPGMNGAEVARQAASRRPGLPVVFVTGYVDTAAFEDIGEERIIKKPFIGDELANKVGAAVSGVRTGTSATVVPIRGVNVRRSPGHSGAS